MHCIFKPSIFKPIYYEKNNSYPCSHCRCSSHLYYGAEKKFENKPVRTCVIKEASEFDRLHEKNIKKPLCFIITDSFLSDQGDNFIPALIEKYKDEKIIVLNECREPQYLKKLLSMRVAGLVHKSTNGPELEEAMHHVLEKDEPYICPKILQILNTEAPSPLNKKGLKISLSPRQSEVFLLLFIEDLPEKLIAEKLGISPQTTHDHHKEINRKMRLSGFGSPLEYGVKMRYITMEQFMNKKK